MVRLRVNSIICLELYNKITDSSPKDVIEFANKGMLLKMDLRVQMHAKSGQLKH